MIGIKFFWYEFEFLFPNLLFFFFFLTTLMQTDLNQRQQKKGAKNLNKQKEKKIFKVMLLEKLSSCFLFGKYFPVYRREKLFNIKFYHKNILVKAFLPLLF